MPSSFPGMGPTVLSKTPSSGSAFQHQLLARLYQIPSSPDSSWTGTRHNASGTRTHVSEMPLFTSIIRDEYTEEFIEIRSRNDNKLVTLVEVVSPANKTTPAGRQAYLDVRANRRLLSGSRRHRRNRSRDVGQADAQLLKRTDYRSTTTP